MLFFLFCFINKERYFVGKWHDLGGWGIILSFFSYLVFLVKSSCLPSFWYLGRKAKVTKSGNDLGSGDRSLGFEQITHLFIYSFIQFLFVYLVFIMKAHCCLLIYLFVCLFLLKHHLCYLRNQEWFANISPQDSVNRCKGGSGWKLHKATSSPLDYKALNL